MNENERFEEQTTPESRLTEEQLAYLKKVNNNFKKGKKAKKVFGAIGLGLVFGLVAGLGFVATSTIANKLASKIHITASSDVDVKTDEKGNKDDKEIVLETAPENKKEAESSKEIPATKVVEAQETDIDPENANVVIGMDVSQIVENTMPSIVSITNKSVQEVRSMFGGGVRQYESESAGSGIIVGQDSEEILIVTNNHVVKGSNELTVGFIDDEICPATVKGTEPDLDLAVIAVKMDDLKDSTLDAIKVAVVGKSSNLKVGEQVIAIGNAMGYGQSVTTGIVSALGRDQTDDNVDNPLIQTDAAINPGNSGGALLNIKGELIGINCAKIASTYVEGVGYAIPMDQATPIIETLMNRVTREAVDEHEAGYIGISGVSVDENTSKSYGIPVGVYVQNVEDDSPAEKAGLIQTDVIRKFDGITVSSINDIRSNLDYYKAGETIELEIYRLVDGEYVDKTIEITLGERKGTSLDPDKKTEEKESKPEQEEKDEETIGDYSDFITNPFSIFGY